jgi:hypothetical protein
MENTMKSLSIIAEMIPKNNPRFFIRRITSLLITFYMSYLFFHFVVLNEFTINNTLVIVVNIWAGHIFLNISTLGVMKNRTLTSKSPKVLFFITPRVEILRKMCPAHILTTITSVLLIVNSLRTTKWKKR